ncbi:alpha/beta fold hydrolase [Mangrovivirga sp. M17]|uniref:Alpha/beta fold hydrolase n=1 Tax=Mangrovivirga halotolerans TaxID=2993936 RepID=A0ABT3RVH1_9BACT|nr:alpha/beta fold hydrolase [Mangrovivirga halotolerans]MCX2745587.1 alpha/beta fold hydrolase [Mangrovivirga halotolerans]
MKTISLSKPWLDTTAYPFDNKFLQLASGTMHYIDEGKGETILFVHGTPTWSFLYRDLIKKLSNKYRCIAIDHLGFGLSEKSASFPGTPEWHSNNLSEFIKRLDLKDITLVVHDFGGPIGLSAGINAPDRIKRVVLYNSWLWATDQEKEIQRIDKIVNSWLGRFLYLNLNFSPRVLLKKGFENKQFLPKNIHQQYIKPFPTKKSRMSLLNLAKALAGSSKWYEEQWGQINLLANKQWLIIWGIRDQFITSKYLRKWQDRIPDAKTIEVDSGHFIQEEKPEESMIAIDNFMT